MQSNWIKFSDEIPTTEALKQVKILFSHPRWATSLVGMYTHYHKSNLRECLSVYDQINDRYIEWESMLPTHWLLLPEKPSFEQKNITL